MKILIIDSTNKRVLIDIDENASVRELKENLRAKKNINSEIILHYNGEILEEDETIASYEIENNSNIVYIGQFKGGMLYKLNYLCIIFNNKIFL